MDAIKSISIIFIFIPILTFGQESKFPKDTIFVIFEEKFDPYDWHKKFEGKYENDAGLFFNIKDSLGNMTLFYNSKSKTDTLPISRLEDYRVLNLKELDKIEKEYYKKRFGRNPWIKNKNGVFHTFLIEVISNDKFIIYPVIWRNEGVID